MYGVPKASAADCHQQPDGFRIEATMRDNRRLSSICEYSSVWALRANAAAAQPLRRSLHPKAGWNMDAGFTDD
jgi:hypothetical protein